MKNFRKPFSIILIIVLLAASLTMFSACNLFNDGSLDEVDGIYGIKQYYYHDIHSDNHNYADKYDYYLLILYNDYETAKVIIKKPDGTETSYQTTYSVTYDTEDTKEVNTVNVKNFKWINYSLSADNQVIATEEIKEISFNLSPKFENLTFTINTLKTNPAGSHILISTRLRFHKIYDSTTDKRIEKAKTKQTNERTDRADKSEAK